MEKRWMPALHRLTSQNYVFQLIATISFISFVSLVFIPGRNITLQRDRLLTHAAFPSKHRSIDSFTYKYYIESKSIRQINFAHEDIEAMIKIDEYFAQPEVNPHNFRYIVNPRDLCNVEDLRYLIYVHSAPEHFKKRLLIRTSWASKAILKKYHMRIVFIMGVINDEFIMSKVKLESDHYNDMVIENFNDSYRNLTFKAIGAIRWVSNYCINPEFVIKTDDDIFIDMFSLMANLEFLRTHGHDNNTLFCYLWKDSSVIRDKNDKWFVSKEEHPDDIYAPYCSGSVFIMTTDVAVGVHGMAYHTPFLWVDDAYITGVIPNKIGTKFVELNQHYIVEQEAAFRMFKNDTNHIYMFYHVPENATQKMWKILNERRTQGLYNDTLWDYCLNFGRS